MKALVVYFSKYGHTQKVAEQITLTLREHADVRLMPSADLAAPDFQTIDLLVMGSPTHRMNLPEDVRPIFDRLPGRILKGVSFTAFDTSYKMSSLLARFTAAKKLTRKLRKLGGKRILPPETFHVVGREGPLYDGELDRAREWAGRIIERMAA